MLTSIRHTTKVESNSHPAQAPMRHEQDMSTIQARDRILDIFVSAGVFLLVWGIILQLARVLQLNLMQLGSLATPTALLLAAFYLLRQYRSTKCDALSGRILIREEWLLLIFSLVFGIGRFFLLSSGTDAMMYLSGPAHHLAYPENSLRFDMAGHYIIEGKPLVGYWLANTLEYLWAYISFLSTVPLPTLYFRLMPAIVIVMAIWSIYCVLLTFGASRRNGALLTLAVVGILFFNIGGNSFGQWSLIRIYEPKPFFVAFILNIMICFYVSILNTQRQITEILTRCFLFGTGFMLTSQTAPYLILSAAVILSISIFITNYFVKQKQHTYALLCLMIFALPAAANIFTPTIIGSADLYKFLIDILNEQNIADPLSSFNTVWNRVFGQFHFGHGSFYAAILIVHLYICYLYRDARQIFLLTYAVIYILLILNPLTFEFMKLFSAKYRVYWRFYYLFPVIIYPALVLMPLFLCHKRYVNSAAASLLIIMFLLFAHSGVNTTRNYFANNFFLTSNVCFGKQFSPKWLSHADENQLNGRLLFSYRPASCYYAVFSPQLTLLSSKHQFTPLYLPRRDALDVARAQLALSEQNSLDINQKQALNAVLKKFQPDLVVIRREKNAEPPASDILKRLGYYSVKFSHQQELYICNSSN